MSVRSQREAAVMRRGNLLFECHGVRMLNSQWCCGINMLKLLVVAGCWHCAVVRRKEEERSEVERVKRLFGARSTGGALCLPPYSRQVVVRQALRSRWLEADQSWNRSST